MIIAHRDLNAFERSLEQGCALHGRVIRRKAGGYEVLINGSKAFLPNACVLKSSAADLCMKTAIRQSAAHSISRRLLSSRAR